MQMTPKELRSAGIPDHPFGILHDMTNEDLSALPHGGVQELVDRRLAETFYSRKQAAKALDVSVHYMSKHKDRFEWARDGGKLLFLASTLADNYSDLIAEGKSHV